MLSSIICEEYLAAVGVCVINKMVILKFLLIFCKSVISFLELVEFKVFVGLFVIISLELLIKVLVVVICCCWLFDNWLGNLFFKFWMVNLFKIFLILFWCFLIFFFWIWRGRMIFL